MELTFLGKESLPDQSPTLYATDRNTYVVQGWIVTDPTALSLITTAGDETIVEVPPKLMIHLAADGLAGEVSHLIPPIVHVLDNGNYIIKGTRVTDTDALARMSIPGHETCVEVPKSAVAELIGG